MQAPFRKQKSPQTYRYDSSLSPALDWVDAVNAEGSYGTWEYAVVESVGEIGEVIRKVGARTGSVG